MGTSQKVWSPATCFFLLSVTGLGLSIGFTILTLPPQHGRRAFPALVLPVFYVVHRMNEVFPDDAMNWIFAFFSILWFSHMSFLVYFASHKSSCAAIDIKPKIIGDSLPLQKGRGKTKVTWTLYHEYILLNRKTAFKMLFNGRGINTPWQVAMRRRETTPRGKFYLQRVLAIVKNYAVLCFIEVLAERVRYNVADDFAPEKRVFIRRMLRDLGRSMGAALADSHHKGTLGSSPPVSFHEVQLRLWLTFYHTIPLCLVLASWHDFLALVFVGLGFDDPEEWPPFFGNIRDAYTVRRWWSYFWHKLAYRSWGALAAAVCSRIPKLPKQSLLDRTVYATLVFAISGFIHMALSYRAGLRCSLHTVLLWYCAQPLAFTLETAVQYCWGRYTAGRHSQAKVSFAEQVLTRIVGYCWVIAWFAWSLPKYQYAVNYCTAVAP